MGKQDFDAAAAAADHGVAEWVMGWALGQSCKECKKILTLMMMIGMIGMMRMMGMMGIIRMMGMLFLRLNMMFVAK